MRFAQISNLFFVYPAPRPFGVIHVNVLPREAVAYRKTYPPFIASNDPVAYGGGPLHCITLSLFYNSVIRTSSFPILL